MTSGGTFLKWRKIYWILMFILWFFLKIRTGGAHFILYRYYFLWRHSELCERKPTIMRGRLPSWKDYFKLDYHTIVHARRAIQKKKTVKKNIEIRFQRAHFVLYRHYFLWCHSELCERKPTIMRGTLPSWKDYFKLDYHTNVHARRAIQKKIQLKKYKNSISKCMTSSS